MGAPSRSAASPSSTRTSPSGSARPAHIRGRGAASWTMADRAGRRPSRPRPPTRPVTAGPPSASAAASRFAVPSAVAASSPPSPGRPRGHPFMTFPRRLAVLLARHNRPGGAEPSAPPSPTAPAGSSEGLIGFSSTPVLRAERDRRSAVPRPSRRLRRVAPGRPTPTRISLRAPGRRAGARARTSCRPSALPGPLHPGGGARSSAPPPCPGLASAPLRRASHDAPPPAKSSNLSAGPDSLPPTATTAGRVDDAVIRPAHASRAHRRGGPTSFAGSTPSPSRLAWAPDASRRISHCGAPRRLPRQLPGGRRLPAAGAHLPAGSGWPTLLAESAPAVLLTGERVVERVGHLEALLPPAARVVCLDRLGERAALLALPGDAFPPGRGRKTSPT